MIRCFLFHRPISCEQRSESPKSTMSSPVFMHKLAIGPTQRGCGHMTLLQTNERR
jgi:hypothetical protein